MIAEVGAVERVAFAKESVRVVEVVVAAVCVAALVQGAVVCVAKLAEEGVVYEPALSLSLLRGWIHASGELEPAASLGDSQAGLDVAVEAVASYVPGSL